MALPLVLFRMAETAFGLGDHRVTSSAAAALAGLDQAAPLTEILAGIARAYATGDRTPAVRAQQQAEAEGAMTLAAEALTVRGRIGDEPARNLAAAHAAWLRIGAPARARAVAAVMGAAGLPVPAERPPQGPADGVMRADVMRADVMRADAPRASGPAPADRPGTQPGPAGARGLHEPADRPTLHISVKTVEAYLTRLYRKTSGSSRVELAVTVTERRIEADE